MQNLAASIIPGEADASDVLSLLDAIETEAVQIGDAVQATLAKQWSS